MKCTKCGIEVPSSYMKCPSCGQGFHGVNTPSSFSSTPPSQGINQAVSSATQSSSFSHTPQSGGIPVYGRPIGGWLMLPAIFLPIGLVVRIAEVFGTFKPFFDPGIFVAIFTSGSATYNPTIGFILIAEILINIFLIGFTCKVSYYFYKKSRLLPQMYIYMLLFWLFGQIIDLIMISQLTDIPFESKDAKELIKGVMALLVWGLYFKKSVRVQQTFVN